MCVWYAMSGETPIKLHECINKGMWTEGKNTSNAEDKPHMFRNKNDMDIMIEVNDMEELAKDNKQIDEVNNKF